MVPQNNAQNLLPYGVDAEYKEAPDEESRRTGVVPLDTLPAQWWNYLWDEVTKNFNRLNASVNALVTELNNVLTEAEKTPDATVQNQVVNSIKALINKAVGDLQTSVAADISTLTTNLGSLQTALSNEVTARTSADTTLQTNIDGKQATITGAATTITANNLTANRVLQSNASGKVAVGGINAIGLISKDSNTSHFLRGDGTWQTPPSNIQYETQAVYDNHVAHTITKSIPTSRKWNFMAISYQDYQNANDVLLSVTSNTSLFNYLSVPRITSSAGGNTIILFVRTISSAQTITIWIDTSTSTNTHVEGTLIYRYW